MFASKCADLLGFRWVDIYKLTCIPQAVCLQTVLPCSQSITCAIGGYQEAFLRKLAIGNDFFTKDGRYQDNTEK